jgi:hypothetical protein
MKLNSLKSFTRLCILSAQLLTFSTAFAKSGGSIDGGGGDKYVIDFISIALNTIRPWLEKNGRQLNVDSEAFSKNVDPKIISSQDHVYESCNETTGGREVEACYNYKEDKIRLSRTMYNIEDQSNAKIALVAHEIFRKMNIEGDNYEITKSSLFKNIKYTINSTLFYKESTYYARRDCNDGLHFAEDEALQACKEQKLKDCRITDKDVLRFSVTNIPLEQRANGMRLWCEGYAIVEGKPEFVAESNEMHGGRWDYWTIDAFGNILIRMATPEVGFNLRREDSHPQEFVDFYIGVHLRNKNFKGTLNLKPIIFENLKECEKEVPKMFRGPSSSSYSLALYCEELPSTSFLDFFGSPKATLNGILTVF